MDGILRRRNMGEEALSWDSISNNKYTGWSRENGSVSDGKIVFNPTQLSWAYRLFANGLKYKWQDVKNAHVKVEFDYVITGINGEGACVSFTPATFSNANATASRQAWYNSAPRIYENGEGHFVFNLYPNTTDAGSTPIDTHFFGCVFYAHTGNGSHVELSNVKVEVAL